MPFKFSNSYTLNGFRLFLLVFLMFYQMFQLHEQKSKCITRNFPQDHSPETSKFWIASPFNRILCFSFTFNIFRLLCCVFDIASIDFMAPHKLVYYGAHFSIGTT